MSPAESYVQRVVTFWSDVMVPSQTPKADPTQFWVCDDLRPIGSYDVAVTRPSGSCTVTTCPAWSYVVDVVTLVWKSAAWPETKFWIVAITRCSASYWTTSVRAP